MTNVANIPREDAEYRVMPHNEEVEQALLGALLVNNKSLEKVSEFLRAAHFYNPVHGRIFEAIVKFVERGQDASPITLKAYFEKDGDLTHVGGGQYLASRAFQRDEHVGAAVRDRLEAADRPAELLTLSGPGHRHAQRAR